MKRQHTKARYRKPQGYSTQVQDPNHTHPRATRLLNGLLNFIHKDRMAKLTPVD